MRRTGRRGFWARLAGTLRLDASVFEEVEHDERALPQAVVVVALAGVARGIQVFPEQGAAGVAVSVLAGFLFWLLVTGAVALVGIHALRGTSSYSELLRTLGFAATPLFGLALCALPLGGARALLSVLLHALAAGALVLAIRQALDVTTSRALVVCAGAIGFGLVVLVLIGTFALAVEP